jgi:hypothetical protein
MSKLYSNVTVLTTVLATVLVSQIAGASPASDRYENQYKEMLQIAQKKVERVQSLRAQASGSELSTSLVRNVLGRYYQVGDNWDVLVWQESSNMAAKTSEPTKVRGRIAEFHYEVVDVKPGVEAQVKVKITQKQDFGLKPLDPSVVSLDLTMSDKFAQSRKVYHFMNARNFAASPNGIHTNVSLLELCPLDVPDIYTAEQSIPTALPVLPQAFQQIAQEAGYSSDLTKSAWFDQEDLFGRSIEILWQHGDLWPAYMKTPGGVAILVRSSTGAVRSANGIL